MQYRVEGKKYKSSELRYKVTNRLNIHKPHSDTPSKLHLVGMLIILNSACLASQGHVCLSKCLSSPVFFSCIGRLRKSSDYKGLIPLNMGCRVEVQIMPIEFILDICRTSELGLQFGCPTVAQPGHQYDVHHYNFGLGKFYGHHMDVYESFREFT